MYSDALLTATLPLPLPDVGFTLSHDAFAIIYISWYKKLISFNLPFGVGLDIEDAFVVNEPQHFRRNFQIEGYTYGANEGAIHHKTVSLP